MQRVRRAIRFQLGLKLAALLALGSAVGLVAAVSPARALLLMVALGGVAAISLLGVQRIVYLTILLVPFQFEYEIPAYSMRIASLDLLILFLTTVTLLWPLLTGHWERLRVPHLGAYLVFILVGLVANLLGEGITDPLQGGWYLYKNVFRFPLIYLIVYANLRTRQQVRTALRALLIGATLSALVGIVQTATGGRFLTGFGKYGNFRYLGLFLPYPADVHLAARDFLGRVSKVTHVIGTNIFRAHGGLSRHNYFGLLLVVTVMLNVGLFLHTQSRRERRLLAVGILVQSLALALTFSRAAWAALLLAATPVALLKRRRKLSARSLKVALAVSLAVGLLLLVLATSNAAIQSRIQSLLNPAENEDMRTRLAIWSLATQQLANNLLLGFGTSQVRDVQMLGHTVTAHNVFLSVGYDRGIIAVMAFLYLCFVFARDAFRLFKKGWDPLCVGVGLGILVGIVGFIAAGMTISPLLLDDTGALFWLMAGLLEAARHLELVGGGA